MTHLEERDLHRHFYQYKQQFGMIDDHELDDAYKEAAGAGMPDFVASHKITLCERIAFKE